MPQNNKETQYILVFWFSVSSGTVFSIYGRKIVVEIVFFDDDDTEFCYRHNSMYMVLIEPLSFKRFYLFYLTSYILATVGISHIHPSLSFL